MALVLAVVIMFVFVGVISTMTRLRPVVVAFVRAVSIVVTIMMIVMIIYSDSFFITVQQTTRCAVQ